MVHQCNVRLTEIRVLNIFEDILENIANRFAAQLHVCHFGVSNAVLAMRLESQRLIF